MTGVIAIDEDETEEIRRTKAAYLDAEQPDWREMFRPGTFGCHEALHMASVLAESISLRLCEHPAVVQRRGWHALAMRAHEAVFELYQAIGAKHLSDEARP